MDRELETYVEQVMEQQEYRSGIFVNWIDTIVNAMANYRAMPDSRGSFGLRGDY